MATPKQPDFLLTSPFAEDGQYMLPPATQQLPGRFSQATGFPVETAEPEAEGGLAPERMDFNGALFAISAFTFWQQSGGMMTWNALLNYGPPSMIIFSGKIWWCVAQNGPGTDAGVKQPGTDTDYWVEFLTFLASVSNIDLDGWDVGDVKMHYGTEAPDGFFVMDGSPFSPTQYPKLAAKLGSSILPDIEGCVPRASDPTGKRDPDGATREIGSIQEDAMRNFTGSFTAHDIPTADGVCYRSQTAVTMAPGGNSSTADRITIDPSRKVPTAPENRMKNMTLLFCIKHD